MDGEEIKCKYCGEPLKLTKHNKKYCNRSCQTRMYYKKNQQKCRDRQNKYRAENPEKVRMTKSEYKRKNKEQVYAKQREYYKKHAERERTRAKEYRLNHKDSIAVYNAKRRDRDRIKNKVYYYKITAPRLKKSRKNNLGKLRENWILCKSGITYTATVSTKKMLAYIHLGRRINKEGNTTMIEKDRVKYVLQAIEEGRTHEAYE